MARNVEIKARIPSVAALLPRAQALADGPPQRIAQDDSFYRCANGRLKLRRFADGSAELIHYQRADDSGPKLSDYVRVPVAAGSADALHAALARANGLLGRVQKQRLLLMAGNTRIHLDEVQGLGSFIELEVLLAPADSLAGSQARAQQLLAALAVPSSALVSGAYLDLLVACGAGAADGPGDPLR